MTPESSLDLDKARLDHGLGLCCWSSSSVLSASSRDKSSPAEVKSPWGWHRTWARGASPGAKPRPVSCALLWGPSGRSPLAQATGSISTLWPRASKRRSSRFVSA